MADKMEYEVVNETEEQVEVEAKEKNIHKVGKFLKRNVKPIVTTVALGAVAYGAYKLGTRMPTVEVDVQKANDIVEQLDVVEDF